MCSFLNKIKIYLSLILLSGLFLLPASISEAQGFYPFFNPFSYYGYNTNFYGYGAFPSIRTSNPYPGFAPAFGSPWLSASSALPSPVFRNAAATITLWLTTGHAPSTLLIYNPTALIGPSAVPVTPSPLLSLIAGTLLTAGADPLSTANPAFFNYLVNTYLLPTGLAFYAIP